MSQGFEISQEVDVNSLISERLEQFQRVSIPQKLFKMPNYAPSKKPKRKIIQSVDTFPKTPLKTEQSPKLRNRQQPQAPMRADFTQFSPQAHPHSQAKPQRHRKIPVPIAQDRLMQRLAAVRSERLESDRAVRCLYSPRLVRLQKIELLIRTPQKVFF